jgi:hypothetical protein
MRTQWVRDTTWTTSVGGLDDARGNISHLLCSENLGVE